MSAQHSLSCGKVQSPVNCVVKSVTYCGLQADFCEACTHYRHASSLDGPSSNGRPAAEMTDSEEKGKKKGKAPKFERLRLTGRATQNMPKYLYQPLHDTGHNTSVSDCMLPGACCMPSQQHMLTVAPCCSFSGNGLKASRVVLSHPAALSSL